MQTTHHIPRTTHLLKILFSIVVFLAPTNLFFNLTEKYAYVTGLRVDYLIPKLYITSIFMITLILFYLFVNYKQLALIKLNKEYVVPIAFLAFIVFQQVVSPLPVIGLFTYVSWLLVLAFCYIAYKLQFFSSKLFTWSIIATLVFQSGVGLLQFILQKSLFGYLFLGETNLLSFAGIAKINLLGVEQIAAYGTTAHPNILAGYLACYSLFLIFSDRKSIHSNIKNLVFSLSIMCILLTGSISAILTLCLGIVLYAHKDKLVKIQLYLLNMIVGLLLIVPIVVNISTTVLDSTSLARRDILNKASLQLIVHQPFGVGLGQFVSAVEKYSQSDEIVRFLQPVHHIPLLIITEIGIMPILFFIFVALYLRKAKDPMRANWSLAILILLPILTLDHYLWSLEPGRLLLGLVIAHFTITINDYNKKI